MKRILSLIIALALLSGAGALFGRSGPGIATVTVPVLNVRAQPGDSSELVTQVLLNNRVMIMEERGSWAKVSLMDQRRSWQGYMGWVKRASIKPVDSASYDGGHWVIVSSPSTRFYSGLKKDAESQVIYFGTYMKYLGYRQDQDRTYGGKPVYWVRCRTFDGRDGWVFYYHTEIRKGAPFITAKKGEEIVRTASAFEGAPYLWGGMTPAGVDCSGLTFMVYLYNGYFIPRDADEQFMVGKSVDFSRLQPGDLLFFGSGSDATHVGIYAGNGWVIHSGPSSGVVMEPFDSPKMMPRCIGARRILD